MSRKQRKREHNESRAAREVAKANAKGAVLRDTPPKAILDLEAQVREDLFERDHEMWLRSFGTSIFRRLDNPPKEVADLLALSQSLPWKREHLYRIPTPRRMNAPSTYEEQAQRMAVYSDWLSDMGDDRAPLLRMRSMGETIRDRVAREIPVVVREILPSELLEKEFHPIGGLFKIDKGDRWRDLCDAVAQLQAKDKKRSTPGRSVFGDMEIPFWSTEGSTKASWLWMDGFPQETNPMILSAFAVGCLQLWGWAAQGPDDKNLPHIQLLNLLPNTQVGALLYQFRPMMPIGTPDNPPANLAGLGALSEQFRKQILSLGVKFDSIRTKEELEFVLELFPNIQAFHGNFSGFYGPPITPEDMSGVVETLCTHPRIVGLKDLGLSFDETLGDAFQAQEILDGLCQTPFTRMKSLSLTLPEIEGADPSALTLTDAPWLTDPTSKLQSIKINIRHYRGWDRSWEDVMRARNLPSLEAKYTLPRAIRRLKDWIDTIGPTIESDS